jgi:anti-sigma factor RsiW
MSEEKVEQKIHALFDGELPSPAALEVESHARACPSCAAAYGRLRSLRSALRSEALRFTPPAALAGRVRAELAGARRPGGQRFVSPLLALAASLLLGVAIGRFLLPVSRELSAPPSVQSIIDAHVRALASGKLTEVASSDQHTVKPWFAGKVPFSPAVKDLASEGFPLLGGRVENVSGTPAAVLVYGRARHVIEVFVRVAERGTEGAGSSEMRGFHVVTWRRRDLVYDAVSDLNEAELGGFAARLAR